MVFVHNIKCQSYSQFPHELHAHPLVVRSTCSCRSCREHRAPRIRRRRSGLLRRRPRLHRKVWRTGRTAGRQGIPRPLLLRRRMWAMLLCRSPRSTTLRMHRKVMRSLIWQPFQRLATYLVLLHRRVGRISSLPLPMARLELCSRRLDLYPQVLRLGGGALCAHDGRR